jgi:hypothetical protein
VGFSSASWRSWSLWHDQVASIRTPDRAKME